jgi:hypothetical protein
VNGYDEDYHLSAGRYLGNGDCCADMHRRLGTSAVLGITSISSGVSTALFRTESHGLPVVSGSECGSDILCSFCRSVWRAPKKATRWSDTLVAGPALLIGGLALLFRNTRVQRAGQLLSFTGFAINLYAMIEVMIGFWAIGRPLQGALLWGNIILTALGVLCMIILGRKLTIGDKFVQQPND